MTSEEVFYCGQCKKLCNDWFDAQTHCCERPICKWRCNACGEEFPEDQEEQADECCKDDVLAQEKSQLRSTIESSKYKHSQLLKQLEETRIEIETAEKDLRQKEKYDN